jgi:hypothetical protein
VEAKIKARAVVVGGMAGQRSKENVKSPAKRKLAPCLLAWVDRSRRPPGVGAKVLHKVVHKVVHSPAWAVQRTGAKTRSQVLEPMKPKPPTMGTDDSV